MIIAKALFFVAAAVSPQEEELFNLDNEIALEDVVQEDEALFLLDEETEE